MLFFETVADYNFRMLQELSKLGELLVLIHYRHGPDGRWMIRLSR